MIDLQIEYLLMHVHVWYEFKYLCHYFYFKWSLHKIISGYIYTNIKTRKQSKQCHVKISGITKNQCIDVDIDDIGGLDNNLTIGSFPFRSAQNYLHYLCAFD